MGDSEAAERIFLVEPAAFPGINPHRGVGCFGYGKQCGEASNDGTFRNKTSRGNNICIQNLFTEEPKDWIGLVEASSSPPGDPAE